MSAKTINNIYILGLGALGGMYASKLQEVNPDNVKIIADTKRIEAYGKTELIINSKKHNFQYVSPGSQVPYADLIIVTVKYTVLQQAIQDLQSFVGPDTIIISLLNGIGSEELIGKTIGMEHLIHAYAVGMDAVREGTILTYANMGRIVFGEKTNGASSVNVTALKELFDRTGIPYMNPANIERAMWSKFMLNVGINQASAILRSSYQAFQSPSPARELLVMAAREVVQISQQCGIDLTENDINDCLKIVETLSPIGKTSMLQDIEAGRKTEVDTFAGTVIEMGKTYCIPTPVNETFYRIIRFMEDSNS
ncbi:ketopantoate reductase family protein [Pedobacter sp. L105]|uniref:ketopantoate reductase family protein n=1 Tax=Pedobacter sp. L105 TaxID=1641871 RepID=UPI00131E55AA|nr:ketopantoate reductase family protein [Pedobacter sp. L105]